MLDNLDALFRNPIFLRACQQPLLKSRQEIAKINHSRDVIRAAQAEHKSSAIPRKREAVDEENERAATESDSNNAESDAFEAEEEPSPEPVAGIIAPLAFQWPREYRDEMNQYLRTAEGRHDLVACSGIFDCSEGSNLKRFFTAKALRRFASSLNGAPLPDPPADIQGFLESFRPLTLTPEGWKDLLYSIVPTGNTCVPDELLERAFSGKKAARLEALRELKELQAHGRFVGKVDNANVAYAKHVLHEFLRLVNRGLFRNENSEGWLLVNVWAPVIDRLFAELPDMKLTRGETCSLSSSERMQKQGEAGARKPSGHKLDGSVIAFSAHNLEVVAIEHKPDLKGVDPKAAEADHVKLIRQMKDMLDRILKRHRFHLLGEHMQKVSVFGIQTTNLELVVSRMSILFPSLTYIVAPVTKFVFPGAWRERHQVLILVREMLRVRDLVLKSIEAFDDLNDRLMTSSRSPSYSPEPLFKTIRTPVAPKISDKQLRKGKKARRQ